MSGSDVVCIVLSWVPVPLVVYVFWRLGVERRRHLSEVRALNRAWAMSAAEFCESMLALNGLDEGAKMGLRAARNVALEEALPSLSDMKEPKL